MELSNKLVDREYKALMEAKAIFYLPLLMMIAIILELDNVKNLIDCLPNFNKPRFILRISAVIVYITGIVVTRCFCPRLVTLFGTLGFLLAISPELFESYYSDPSKDNEYRSRTVLRLAVASVL